MMTMTTMMITTTMMMINIYIINDKKCYFIVFDNLL